MTLAIAQSAMADSANKDLGNPDKLRLVGGHFVGTEYHVTVHVDNDQDLTALDIPLRFAQPGDPMGLNRPTGGPPFRWVSRQVAQVKPGVFSIALCRCII